MKTTGLTKAERLAARWAPVDGQREDFPLLDVVVWRYEERGWHMACVYRGAKRTPEFRYRFQTPQAREDYLGPWLAGVKRKLEEKAAAKAEYKARAAQFLAALKPGDIFYYTGGWEQTNAYFFQVVGAVKRGGVAVRPVEQDTVESAPQAMSGYATPCRGKFNGPERVFRTSKQIPTIWKEGERVNVTWYG